MKSIITITQNKVCQPADDHTGTFGRDLMDHFFLDMEQLLYLVEYPFQIWKVYTRNIDYTGI